MLYLKSVDTKRLKTFFGGTPDLIDVETAGFHVAIKFGRDNKTVR